VSEGFDLALDLYETMTRHLLEYQDWLELENVLLWRDTIADGVESGHRLNEEEASALAGADSRLMAARVALLERFPRAFRGQPSEPRPVSRRRWWWRLPEGPHVREEAEAA
jgi:hypothetical protein